jgi:hypothetical protein
VAWTERIAREAEDGVVGLLRVSLVLGKEGGEEETTLLLLLLLFELLVVLGNDAGVGVVEEECNSDISWSEDQT